MSRIKNSSVLRKIPHIVAAVHSAAALRKAQEVRTGEVDFLEIRVDNFALNPTSVLKILPRLRVPLIVTVRHPAEGGDNDLGLAQRRELFAQFLPYAALIDLEVRSLKNLAGVVVAARQQGVKVIVSAHDFRSTPSAARLQRDIDRAHQAGADICKLAARADTPAALGRLLAILGKKQPLPLSVMGMGKFGKISRLLFAKAGSILNYGYLDRPNASGQWEAALLKKRVAEILAD